MSVAVRWQRTLRRVPRGVSRSLYCGEDAAWRLQAGRGILAELEEVATGPAREHWAAELRGPYIDWLAELGVERDSFDWWSSPLAAKNVYAHLFSRIVSLAAALDLLEDGVLAVGSTPALAAELAEAARSRGFDVRGGPGRNLRRPAYMAAWRVGQAVLREGWPRDAPGSATTLLATWIDERSFGSDGAYRDPHFGPLPEMLRERGEEVAFLARPLPGTRGRGLAGRLAGSDATFLLPGAYLSAADRREARARAFSFDPQIAPDATVGPVPVARLARELVAQERINHAEALSYGALMRNIAAAGARFERVIVPWEGHAWETALIAAARDHLPGCRAIGYDNVNFSTLALSLYPGEAELAVRPLPDRVVTNGETFARVLREQGFPPERIQVGCALRHEYIHRVEARAGAQGFVLAAGSIDAAQTIELVDKAHAAFGDELVVKLHPAVDDAHVRQALPAEVNYADRPLDELLREARTMLYTYSVVAYEALAAGVPPIFVRSETLLDLDQLEPTPDLRLAARTVDELREADRAAGSFGPEWTAHASKAVRDALGPVSAGCVDAFL